MSTKEVNVEQLRRGRGTPGKSDLCTFIEAQVVLTELLSELVDG